MARLGDYVKIKTGKLDANASSETGQYPFFTCSVTPLRIDTYSYDCECVLVAGNGDLNVKYYNGKFDAYQRTYIIESKDKNALTVPYLYCFLDGYVEELRKQSIGGVIKYIKLGNLTEAQIPICSIEKQNEIVENFDKVNTLISLRKQQLSKLDELVKSRFIEMFGDPKYNKSNLVKIDEIGALTSGGTPSRAKPEYFEGDIRWYSAGELNSLYLPDSVEHISEMALQQSSAKLFNKGTLMIGMYDTAAFKMGILTEDSSSNQACANLNPKQGYNIVWLYYLFDIMKPIFLQERQGVRQKNLSLSKIKEFEVPFEPFELQEKFAAFVEQTDKSKFEIQKSLAKLETLKKALMQKYFG
ncbi:MAG: restriction endonuclease subunit S [Clostridia bacterium]|nr:restriction endonuclease subunit S [Clostridia bacterium]